MFLLSVFVLPTSISVNELTALQAFRHNEEFRVDAFDLKKNMHANRNDVDEAFLNQYEVDRRSVFIGSLPQHITEDDLMDLFADIGPILDIQLVKKPTSGVGKQQTLHSPATSDPYH